MQYRSTHLSAFAAVYDPTDIGVGHTPHIGIYSDFFAMKFWTQSFGFRAVVTASIVYIIGLLIFCCYDIIPIRRLKKRLRRDYDDIDRYGEKDGKGEKGEKGSDDVIFMKEGMEGKKAGDPKAATMDDFKKSDKFKKTDIDETNQAQVIPDEDGYDQSAVQMDPDGKRKRKKKGGKLAKQSESDNEDVGIDDQTSISQAPLGKQAEMEGGEDDDD